MAGPKYRFAENCEIRYDESGELQSGVFFEIKVQYDCDCVFGQPDESWYVVNITDGSSESYDGWIWGEFLAESNLKPARRNVCTCPLSASHVTRQVTITENVYVDLSGDTEFSDFVPGSHDFPLMVSEAFHKRLKTTGLTGIQWYPLKIGVNQSDATDPKLFLLECTGTIWERPLQVVGLPNACPHCGHAPMICPECGHSDHLCSRCHLQQSLLPKTTAGEEDTYLRQADVPRQGRILLGKTWTGEDFVESRRSRFITKRALDWLLMVHAKPFYARPARVAVEGMSAEQLQWLNDAQDMASGGRVGVFDYTE